MKKFNELFMTTKESIIKTSETGIELINNMASKDKTHSAAYYSALKDRLNDFISYIETCNLPILNDDFAYFVEVKTDAITLFMKYIMEYKLIEGSDKKKYINADEYEIIKLPFKLLTIEEYARLNGVTSYVISQCIRRGKLKNIKKIGREWYIPEIEEFAKDNKETVYVWKTSDEKIFDKDYDYLNNYTRATIRQSEKSKMSFNVDLYDSVTGNSEIKELDTKEKQKFEIMLISNDRVKLDNNMIIRIG